jgi:hypothetical protein
VAYFVVGDKFQDMKNLAGMLAIATRHVEESRRIVERQRMLIAEKRGGPGGLELLRTFEHSQEIFERI